MLDERRWQSQNQHTRPEHLRRRGNWLRQHSQYMRMKMAVRVYRGLSCTRPSLSSCSKDMLPRHLSRLMAHLEICQYDKAPSAFWHDELSSLTYFPIYPSTDIRTDIRTAIPSQEIVMRRCGWLRCFNHRSTRNARWKRGACWCWSPW